MPYKIRKAPGKERYWAVNPDTGERFSRNPLPKSRAIRQVRALYASENDTRMRKRSVKGGNKDDEIARALVNLTQPRVELYSQWDNALDQARENWLQLTSNPDVVLDYGDLTRVVPPRSERRGDDYSGAPVLYRGDTKQNVRFFEKPGNKTAFSATPKKGAAAVYATPNLLSDPSVMDDPFSNAQLSEIILPPGAVYSDLSAIYQALPSSTIKSVFRESPAAQNAERALQEEGHQEHLVFQPDAANRYYRGLQMDEVQLPPVQSWVTRPTWDKIEIGKNMIDYLGDREATLELYKRKEAMERDIDPEVIARKWALERNTNAVLGLPDQGAVPPLPNMEAYTRRRGETEELENYMREKAKAKREQMQNIFKRGRR